MANNETAPAGSRKYLLIQPDTFELLINNFEEVQRVKHQPAIKLALEFEKHMLALRQQDASPQKSLAAVQSLVRQYNRKLLGIYNIADWCDSRLQKEAAEKPQPVKYATDDPVMTMPSAAKKVKWVSFRK